MVPGGREESTWQDGHPGRLPGGECPSMDHSDIWGTWSPKSELPFSNYFTALTVGTFVPRGTGAEVRKGRCGKPRGLHSSSQTQKSKLCSAGQRRTSLFTSLWLTPGCPQGVQALRSASCWHLRLPLRHTCTGPGGSSTPTLLTPPWPGGSSSTPPAEKPCSFLKISWGFHSFSCRGHDYQGGEGPQGSGLPVSELFSSIKPPPSPPYKALTFDLHLFLRHLLIISIVSRMFLYFIFISLFYCFKFLYPYC